MIALLEITFLLGCMIEANVRDGGEYEGNVVYDKALDGLEEMEEAPPSSEG